MFFSLTACANKSELEMGFTPYTDSNLPTQYFRVYFAYRFPKAKFDLDDVTVQIFYGHRLPDGLKNVETDTKIQFSFHSSNKEIKQVDDFFSEDYAAKLEKGKRGARSKIIYSYSETIQIPKETFITTSDPYDGKRGSFQIGVFCKVTNINEDFFVTNGIDVEKYGRTYSGYPVYYRIDGEKVTVRNNSSIL